MHNITHKHTHTHKHIQGPQLYELGCLRLQANESSLRVGSQLLQTGQRRGLGVQHRHVVRVVGRGWGVGVVWLGAGEGIPPDLQQHGRCEREVAT